MPRHRVAKTLLCIFFAVQTIVAFIAYRTARVEGEAQRLGWQMFTGHTEDPTFVLITPSGEDLIPKKRVFLKHRSELNDGIVFEPHVVDFLCAIDDSATAARITSANGETRTEPCERR